MLLERSNADVYTSNVFYRTHIILALQYTLGDAYLSRPIVELYHVGLG